MRAMPRTMHSAAAVAAVAAIVCAWRKSLVIIPEEGAGR